MATWKPLSDKPSAASGVSVRVSATSSKKPLTNKDMLEFDDGHDKAGSKGFDPYNSGAFNVRDTWSRVNRK